MASKRCSFERTIVFEMKRCSVNKRRSAFFFVIFAGMRVMRERVAMAKFEGSCILVLIC